MDDIYFKIQSVLITFSLCLLWLMAFDYLMTVVTIELAVALSLLNEALACTPLTINSTQ